MVSPRLAFISLWDAGNPNVESGYGYSMRCQLQKYFEVSDLFPMRLPGEALALPLRAAYKMVGRYYHPMREPAVLKQLARRIEHRLSEAKPDVFFAPSSVPMSFVETRRPWVYATDQLFSQFIATYIPNPAARFRRLGEAQERCALAAAARASFPSRWAADAAITAYGADPAKVAMIPWGANLPNAIGDEEIEEAIDSRSRTCCELVFIGGDWERKGGDIVVATVSALAATGIDVHTTIIGCDPPGLAPDRFTVHPFLDKSRPDDFARFAAVMRRAHFHFMPSRAEAYGQAFCEAAAFGVPSISCAVGGIPTIIREGETGRLLPPGATASEFATLIRDTLADAEHYRRLADAARRDYCARLNWDSFGARLRDVIMEVL